MDRTYIGKLERDLKSPTLNTLFRLCGALGISAARLIHRVQKNRPKNSWSSVTAEPPEPFLDAGEPLSDQFLGLSPPHIAPGQIENVRVHSVRQALGLLDLSDVQAAPAPA